MKVLLFGQLAEKCGTDNLEISQVKDTDQAMEVILKLAPQLKSTATRLALNQQLVISNRPINENDELALLPPFAGG